tara:strand:- start:512 stop:709 length:198 start_codon:yes stop_codon:yes gene_type:complete
MYSGYRDADYLIGLFVFIALIGFVFGVRFLGQVFGWIPTRLDDWLERNEWIIFVIAIVITAFFLW